MGFTFGNNALDLEIEGSMYRVDPFAEGALRGVKEFRAKISDADLVDMPDESKVIELCGYVRAMIDEMLGDGAYAKIFAGRTVNLLDHYELAMHVITSVMAFRGRRITEFTGGGIATAHAIIGSKPAAEKQMMQ